MRGPKIFLCSLVVGLLGLAGSMLVAGDTNVVTAVFARAGNGYKRAISADGSFKPEYYAISNGGRVDGTTTDATIDRVTYPEVAAIAMRQLAGQNYHMSKNSRDATLLIMVQWGATQSYNRGNYDDRIQSAANALTNLQAAGGGSAGLPPSAIDASPEGAMATAAQDVFESDMLRLVLENQMRDSINLPNARLLGFVDEINSASRIPRHTAAATRYDELIADIEDPRYYIIVSAYDFQELRKNNQKKLLWVTRVSVNTRGNRFDDSAAAMLKSASKYFGQDSGKLIRGQEDKGEVRLGDVKFLGEQKDQPEK